MMPGIRPAAPNIAITSYSRPILSAINGAIAIQSEFTVAHDLVARGQRDALNGALIASYVPEQISEKIEGGAVLHMAQQNSDRSYVGYLFQITGKQFHEQFPGSHIQWNTPDLEQRYDEDVKLGKFVYLSQIGVRLCSHGSGLASKLLTDFEQYVRNALIVCTVVKEPFRNPRSKRFFNKHGYEDSGTFFKKAFGGFRQSTSDLLIKNMR